LKLRIFKIKVFNRWAEKADLTNEQLIRAAEEIKDGLVDAHLGGNLYKKRIASSTRGKSGGFRTLLAYKKGTVIFFMDGLKKGEKENITIKEQEVLKELAEYLLSLSNKDILHAIKVGILFEA
jgi:hypothetical protein